MSKPFDAATRYLVEIDPLAWLQFAGLSGSEAELIDANLSTVTSEADRILHVKTPEYMAHVELQATYKDNLPYRVLRYNALTFCRYLLPVQSILVLLRKEADGPALTGNLGYVVPQGAGGSLTFTYHIVRVWEKDVEDVLTGALATLPLAPLTNVSPDALPDVVRRMEERIDAEAQPAEKEMLWTTTYLLMGLRYEPDVTRELLKGVLALKESSTYMEIFEEGEASGLSKGETRGERNLILRIGHKRFGTPDAATVAALEAITSLDTLEQLAERLLEVETWDELLNEQ